MLKADYKVKEIAALFNCGEQLIRFRARDAGYIFSRGNRTPKKPKAAANGRKMCACCGLKIAERIRSIKYHLTSRTMDLTMSKKDADKYQQKMMRVKAVLNELMAEHAGLDYLNCLLALSEDVVEASVKFKNRSLAYDWDKITRLLVELYEQDDPEFMSKKIDAGLFMAKRVKAVIWS